LGTHTTASALAFPATRPVSVHLFESAPTAAPVTHTDLALRLTAQAVLGFTVSLADIFAE
jgi:hypothetical protein